MQESIISLRSVTKSFGATVALSQVDINLAEGSVHAIVGENGAGKSTLMKILAGVFPADKGELSFRGKPFCWASPREARKAGISIVFQEFSLIPQLSILENLILEDQNDVLARVDRNAYRAKIQAGLRNLGMDTDPDKPIASLSVCELQLVEIAKGLVAQADVFIFDEPTAALNDEDAARLLEIISGLRASGKSIFYISHRLKEVLEVSDEITIIKDGQTVASRSAETFSEAEIIRLMVGREPGEMFPPRPEKNDGAIVFSAHDLTSRVFSKPLSLELRSGEITGLAGLEGHGQLALIRHLYGDAPLTGGEISINGQVQGSWSIPKAISLGVGLIPEDRKTDGLFLALGVERNILAPSLIKRRLWQRLENLHAQVMQAVETLRVRMSGLKQPAGGLSGGNQQKLLVGRWQVRRALVVLCEEITRGVDVGSRADIYRQLRNMAQGGSAILVSSRDLTELLGLCDRILVIHDKSIVAEFDAASASENAIMQAALGIERGE